MAEESPFVGLALIAAQAILQPPLSIKRGASLLYQVTVDNLLNLTVDPKSTKRGSSAFQTDLCIFEQKSETVIIPRVVIEFKTAITTHDVITYSAKARKHKQVYPYLRYGIVASSDRHVAKRLLNHNESLDFCAAVAGLGEDEFIAFFTDLLAAEVQSSRNLEAVSFGNLKTRLFRSDVFVGAP